MAVADTRRRLIVGNWKMHGLRSEGERLIDQLIQGAHSLPESVRMIVCPPSTLLWPLSFRLGTIRRIELGGQDCHSAKEGAYTGDISAPMLAEAGCRFVLCGHSERRMDHGETTTIVRAKAEAALAAGLRPIICVGEHKAVRVAGDPLAYVATQLEASLPKGGAGPVIVAYEPVWSIGSGLIPEISDITAMHARINEVLAAQDQQESLVLYGGSVRPDNAQAILSSPGVDGVLVGGASLKAAGFLEIARVLGAVQR